jgi:uncharacterized protein YbbC (DUF1343 family)
MAVECVYPWSRFKTIGAPFSSSMSVVSILNIQVLDNPTKFSNPFQFEITFECISHLKNGIFIKITH